VRNLISQQDGIKTAYLGFLDRFRSPPGDYSFATLNIGGATVNGNGNGQIESVLGGGTIDEHIAAWEHLSRAGFISGSYTYAALPESSASAPTSAYAHVSYIQLIFDNVYGAGGGPLRHNFKTGNQIPAEVLAEIDRKIDDGDPLSGAFQFSVYNGGPSGTAPTPTGVSGCYFPTSPASWGAPGVTNCGAALLLQL
jgi:hypothetical protein